MSGEKVLGTLPLDKLENKAPESAEWQGPDGTKITVTEPPPPWEINQGSKADSDARRFVDVPENWVLHWINPRLLETFGWRDWQPVMASDPRVKVHVSTMVSPEGNIRRGGLGGDILAWMYRSWVESRRRSLAAETARLTQSSVDRHSELEEAFRRGAYGPHLKFGGGVHPTHTIGEGKTMRD